MDYMAKIAKIASQHQGTVTAQEGGTYRVEFTEQVRAEGAYDDFYCRHWATATWDGCTVVTVQV